MSEHCTHCPVKDKLCYAVQTGHRRFCELIANGRDDYRRLMIERSGYPIEKSDWDQRIPPGTIKQVYACPHRGPQIAAGCGCRYRCELGKGDIPGEVTVRECLLCVSGATRGT